jgi:hypothetical protein
VNEKVVMLGSMVHRCQSVVEHGRHRIGQVISRLTKPISFPALGTRTDLARSNPQLGAETLLLRQHRIVLHRSAKRPRLTMADRTRLVLLARLVRRWNGALLIVKPTTVLRWHRHGFRVFTMRKSRAPAREPQIPVETIALIKLLAAENRLWGAERIRGA